MNLVIKDIKWFTLEFVGDHLENDRACESFDIAQVQFLTPERENSIHDAFELVLINDT
jgi:hypothetical protein